MNSFNMSEVCLAILFLFHTNKHPTKPDDNCEWDVIYYGFNISFQRDFYLQHYYIPKFDSQLPQVCQDA